MKYFTCKFNIQSNNKHTQITKLHIKSHSLASLKAKIINKVKTTTRLIRDRKVVRKKKKEKRKDKLFNSLT
jgi:hypothetical protein